MIKTNQPEPTFEYVCSLQTQEGEFNLFSALLCGLVHYYLKYTHYITFFVSSPITYQPFLESICLLTCILLCFYIKRKYDLILSCSKIWFCASLWDDHIRFSFKENTLRKTSRETYKKRKMKWWGNTLHIVHRIKVKLLFLTQKICVGITFE